jgi:hypothetical protein
MDMKKILQAFDNAGSNPVEGSSDMKKFLQVVTEGANPHKVSLPVQMVMQHYQTADNKPVEKKSSLLKKFYHEVETEKIAEHTKEQEQKQQLIRQYAQTIAERVMMKESVVNEKSVSQKQARTMAAAAHDPAFAKKVGIKTSVAKEFNKADTGTKLLSQAMKKKKSVEEGQLEEHEISGHSVGFTGGVGPGLQSNEPTESHEEHHGPVKARWISTVSDEEGVHHIVQHGKFPSLTSAKKAFKNTYKAQDFKWEPLDESRSHKIVTNKLKDIERAKKFASGELKTPTHQERLADLEKQKEKNVNEASKKQKDDYKDVDTVDPDLAHSPETIRMMNKYKQENPEAGSAYEALLLHLGKEDEVNKHQQDEINFLITKIKELVQNNQELTKDILEKEKRFQAMDQRFTDVVQQIANSELTPQQQAHAALQLKKNVEKQTKHDFKKYATQAKKAKPIVKSVKPIVKSVQPIAPPAPSPIINQPGSMNIVNPNINPAMATTQANTEPSAVAAATNVVPGPTKQSSLDLGATNVLPFNKRRVGEDIWERKIIDAINEIIKE